MMIYFLKSGYKGEELENWKFSQEGKNILVEKGGPGGGQKYNILGNIYQGCILFPTV